MNTLLPSTTTIAMLGCRGAPWALHWAALVASVTAVTAVTTVRVTQASRLDTPAPAEAAPYVRLANGRCAQAELPSFIGPCPRSVPVLFGRLQPGTCSGFGYTVPVGPHRVLAGPCGWLIFDVFERESSLPVPAPVPLPPQHTYFSLPLATSCAPSPARISPP